MIGHLRFLSLAYVCILVLFAGCGSEGTGESQRILDAMAVSDAGVDAQADRDGDRDDASDQGVADGGTGPAPTTAQVFAALEPHCVACHGENTQDPYFESLDNFERLVVANPEYVVAGNAYESELSAMLAGSGTGSFRQMPPFGDSYVCPGPGRSSEYVRGRDRRLDQCAAPHRG